MKKIKFISLALLVAFALMGSAFAAWTQTININGSVATGNLDVTFFAASTDDQGTSIDPTFDKNVGETESNIAGDAKSLTVTSTNGYPGYNATTTYTIKNTGTIPVKITGAVITNNNSEISVSNVIDPAGQIIDAGGTFVASAKSVVNDNAPNQIASYSYGIAVNATQWNAAP